MFAAGVVMFFLPLLRMAGFIAVLAAAAYYVTILIVRTIDLSRKRPRS
jgi:hypothetical protein